MAEQPGRLRINLLDEGPEDDAPKAGTVSVTFDGSDNSVSLENGDVTVTKKKMRVLFDLTTKNMPAGASATIAGVEFAKADEPSGPNAPSTSIFGDQNTITDPSGKEHTVYGEWKGDKARLKLVDEDPLRKNKNDTEQDYGYCVWVGYNDASGTTHYSSPDPEIKNKPTTS